MTNNEVYAYLILCGVCIIFALYICCFCCDIKTKNVSRNNLIYTNQNNINHDDNYDNSVLDDS